MVSLEFPTFLRKITAQVNKKKKHILVSSRYHSAVAAVSELEWAVRAAGMEAVVQALVVEAVGVWPGLESLQTQKPKIKKPTF